MRIAIAAVSCFLILGCSTKPSSEAFRVQSFITLDSILAAQQGLLIGKQLTKSVLIDDALEQSVISIDSAFIQNEWSFLKEFDLNKPGFVGGIQVVETDELIRYEPKANQTYLLEYLQYRYKQNGELAQISGAFKDQKAKSLYESTREFRFDFVEGVVKEYTISGYQKIVMNDTVFFQIVGELQ